MTGLNDTEKQSVVLCTAQLIAHEIVCEADALMEASIDPAPTFVFCGTLTGEISANEIAQLLRSCHQDAQIFFVSSNRETFKRDLLKKNGFNDAFLVPFDNGLIKDAILVRLVELNATTEKSYRPVSLIDITPDTKLTFDVFVFLPMNGKHVKFSSANEALSEKRTDRLKKHQIQSVYVDAEQMQSFYRFTAEALKKMDSSDQLSETEKRERKQRAVRDLMSQMFSTDSASDFTKGQELVNDCNEIIKAYVVSGNEKNAWFEKIMNHSGGVDGSYSHNTNVATFAALFSIGLSIGKPEDLAMAGLLHDIGLTDLPPHIQQKKESELTATERLVFQEHPKHSVKMIKQRRLVVPEKVIRAIAEHHEHVSGCGYPNALTGDRICSEAQVLSIADVFSELTSLEAGRARMMPIDAIRKMIDDTTSNPGKAQFDIALLRRLSALFPSPTSIKSELSA